MRVLFVFSLIQISIYTILVPVLRVVFFDVEIKYAYDVALLFLFSFCIGGLFYWKCGSVSRNRSLVIDFDISYSGFIFLSVWCVVVSWISFEYGLYDRRIGTENVAELFSGIPLVTLVVFRSFEIAVPVLFSIVIINALDRGGFLLREKLILIFLAGTFFMLGAAGSRSATMFFVVTVLAMIQNRIPKRRAFVFAVWFLVIATFILAVVTISRLGSDDYYNSFTEYFSSEVMARLDGLELLSEIVTIHGEDFFGVNWKAALNPIVSHLAFLEDSSVLKSAGLTSIKSVALLDDLGSNMRDFNSFVVFDIYYLAGLFGVIVFGILLGVVCNVVDLEIARSSTRFSFVLTMAVALNIVVLEREGFSIIFAIFRDFCVLALVSYVLLDQKKNH